MKAIRIRNPKGLVFLGEKNTDEVMQFTLNCEHGNLKITFQSYAYLDGMAAVPVVLNTPEFEMALCLNETVVEAVKRATMDETLANGAFIELKGGAVAADELRRLGLPMEGIQEELEWVDINGVREN